jgi:hypothetical protein
MEGQMPPFTQEEARNMACLFLQTAIDQTPLEEVLAYVKNKGGEK